MNSPQLASVLKAQLTQQYRKTWHHLAGRIGNRVPPSEDRDKFIAKVRATLLCAVSGTDWDAAKAMDFNEKEMKRLIVCFEELTADLEGENGPGIPWDMIPNEVGLQAANLKLDRLHGKFEEDKVAAPPKKAVSRKTHHLPPIGTSVWSGTGMVLLEVVPTPIRYFKGDGTPTHYDTTGGRALLVLNGDRVGAFNAAPTALVTAIFKGEKCRSGWAAMSYDPASLGSGEPSEAAKVILGSNQLYLCEVPKGGSLPPESHGLKELAQKHGIGKPFPVVSALLEAFDTVEAEAEGSEAPVAAPVAPPPPPVPAPVDFTEMLRQLRELLPVARERDSLMAAVRRYNEILPKVTEFESLKLKFRQSVAQEQKRLAEEYIAKKFDLPYLTHKLAELEDVAREF